MLTYSNVRRILYEAHVFDPGDAHPSPGALNDQGNLKLKWHGCHRGGGLFPRRYLQVASFSHAYTLFYKKHFYKKH